MSSYIISIKWEYATEYVQIDIPALLSGAEVKTTSEWWPDERSTVVFNTSSSIRRIDDDELELTIFYDHSNNKHVPFDDACWGRSVIRIGESSVSGVATWSDNDDSSYNGDAKWKRLSDSLFKEKKREQYSRIQREQDMFRAALLAADRRCLISGEKMIEVLEAVHIIPSSQGGAEVSGNGIILRSDIHRLYDSGLFIIDPSGKVVVTGKISEKYEEILRGAEIPKEAAQRVQEALIHQWNGASVKELPETQE